jgi:hypothetical protein
VTLFFVAAHKRASNDIPPEAPMVAMPIMPDLLF